MTTTNHQLRIETTTDHLPCDLAHERDQMDRDGTPSDVYTILLYDERGYQLNCELPVMLYVQGEGRAGIAWGADADWTDADSPEDAARRWSAGEMTG